MAETRPGNHDRGWNDPPVFLHNSSSVENTTPKKNLLNKRVAHPVHAVNHQSSVPGIGSVNASTPQTGHVLRVRPSTGIPGTITSTPPPPKPLIFSPLLNDSSNVTPKSAANHNVTEKGEVLEEILKKIDAILSQLKVRVQEDIKKRLNILQEFWKDGKISTHVKLKMLALAEALEKRNCDEANTIHLGLMLDYTNEVGQWMVGIKKLIYETRSLPVADAVEHGKKDNVESVTDICTTDSNLHDSASNIEDLTLNSETEVSNQESVPSSETRDNPEDEISNFQKDCDNVGNDLPECNRTCDE